MKTMLLIVLMLSFATVVIPAAEAGPADTCITFLGRCETVVCGAFDAGEDADRACRAVVP